MLCVCSENESINRLWKYIRKYKAQDESAQARVSKVVIPPLTLPGSETTRAHAHCATDVRGWGEDGAVRRGGGAVGGWAPVGWGARPASGLARDRSTPAMTCRGYQDNHYLQTR